MCPILIYHPCLCRIFSKLIGIEATTPAKQKSLRVEPRFRLLLKLLHFSRTECKAIARTVESTGDEKLCFVL